MSIAESPNVAQGEAVAPKTRMASDERRILILDAATEVFGQRGYAGATTDQVASAAGVSQPYVVRMFGTKEKLFLEVLHRDLQRMLEAFRAEIAAPSSDGTVRQRLGIAYVDLLRDRGLLLSLMHGFVMGTDPVIGKVARWGFLEVYRFLKSAAGFTPEEASDFMAQGMLLNTLVGMQMTEEYNSSEDARELLTCALQTKLSTLLEVAGEAQSTRAEPRQASA